MDAPGAKRELRRLMRSRRREIAERARRSDAACDLLAELPEIATAEVVMAYRAIGTELDPARFVASCRARGVTLVVPAADPAAAPPPDPSMLDVVVVPGLAFTADGRRLGQGGGWYDRVLAGIADGCLTIGIGFADQVVDHVPTEPHDVRVDVVVTDRAVHRVRPGRRAGRDR